jgi:hypothetical protein
MVVLVSWVAMLLQLFSHLGSMHTPGSSEVARVGRVAMVACSGVLSARQLGARALAWLRRHRVALLSRVL